MGNIESSTNNSLKFQKKSSVALSENTQVNLKRRKIRCLIIGIDYVGTAHRLNGCSVDAVDMLRELQKKTNFSVSETLFLSDNLPVSSDLKHPVGTSVRSEFPNRRNILSALNWLLFAATSEEFVAAEFSEDSSISSYEPLQEDTLCLFYYAGHGSWTWDLSGDEADSRDEALCPVTREGTMDELILDDTLRELVRTRTSTVQKVTLFAITDCCHSGSNFDLKYHLDGNCFIPSADAASYSDTRIPVLHLAGCRDNQYSAEDASGGYMTQSLLEIMQKSHLDLFHFFRLLNRAMIKKIPWQQQSIVFSSGKLISAHHKFPL
jgi:hypothetical protein